MSCTLSTGVVARSCVVKGLSLCTKGRMTPTCAMYAHPWSLQYLIAVFFSWYFYLLQWNVIVPAVFVYWLERGYWAHMIHYKDHWPPRHTFPGTDILLCVLQCALHILLDFFSRYKFNKIEIFSNVSYLSRYMQASHQMPQVIQHSVPFLGSWTKRITLQDDFGNERTIFVSDQTMQNIRAVIQVGEKNPYTAVAPVYPQQTPTAAPTAAPTAL